MPGRLITMQRQLRELGRLRTGYTDGHRPVRSDTWIVSSHAEHYVQAAADAWGGEVEKWQPQGGGAAQWRVRTSAVALDALLPPGDPLSQSLEQWGGGGALRRCDGVTEMLSDSPCLCRARFGDAFHEQAKGTVCATTTRLNVFLPEMPDVGVFRAETHSHYAAQEIAGAVDLIKSATGPDMVIPIRLRIEQRQRKADGQTKRYPVIVVELRGITTGQVLQGSVMGQALPAAERQQIASVPAPRAIEASAPAPIVQEPPPFDVESVRAALLTVNTLEDLRMLWPDAVAAGLQELAKDIAASFQKTNNPDAATNIGQSVDRLWSRIMETVPAEWPTSKVEAEFEEFSGTPVEKADAEEMAAYLAHLGGVA